MLVHHICFTRWPSRRKPNALVELLAVAAVASGSCPRWPSVTSSGLSRQRWIPCLLSKAKRSAISAHGQVRGRVVARPRLGVVFEPGGGAHALGLVEVDEEAVVELALRRP